MYVYLFLQYIIYLVFSYILLFILPQQTLFVVALCGFPITLIFCLFRDQYNIYSIFFFVFVVVFFRFKNQ